MESPNSDLTSPSGATPRQRLSDESPQNSQQTSSSGTSSSGISDLTTPSAADNPLTRTISTRRRVADDDESIDESDEESFGEADSLVEAADFEDFNLGAEEAQEDRLMVAIKQEDGEGDYVVDFKPLDQGTTRIPQIPASYTPKRRDEEKGEPEFANVDNPGGWNNYVFRPKFAKSGNKQYLHHSLPSGAVPVPVDPAQNRRVEGGWEFHYGDWESDIGTHRGGASTENMFPNSRKGSLDKEMLKKLGLTQARMEDDDALFFLQLLLPIGDPAKSGIDEDPRLPFYSNVQRWSMTYACQHGLGLLYGHEIKTVKVHELLAFHGVLIRDGVHGGSNGGLFRRWKETTSTFDKDIQDAMTLSRWRQIKKIIKLNDNSTAPKPGSDDYDPAYKFDYLYKVIVENLNAVTEKAEVDLCGDETTWAFLGYGEAGPSLVSSVEKPHVTRGGQTVLLTDASRNRPRAYVHRHKKHARPAGFGKEGPNEVRMLVGMLKELVVGGDGDKKKIFPVKPHMTFDNFFSGDEIMSFIGENGFGATMTCRRDRLPRGVRKIAFHHEKMSVDARNKVARFLPPITAVKKFPAAGDKLAYERAHVSFQSTGATNISTVNALNANKQFVVQKVRGRGEDKHKWGIEMNDARQMYLKTYGRVDTIDQMIQHCNMKYRSMKYWHSAMNHGMALAIVVAYDMYLEVASGDLEEEWKCEPMDFHSFRDKLSTQAMTYRPRHQMYPGDSKMRETTSISIRHRSRSLPTRKRGRPSAASVASGDRYCVSVEEVRDATAKKRLCGDLGELAKHLRSFTEAGSMVKSGRQCAWCGDTCYSKCTVCGVPLHNFPAKGSNKGSTCSVDYHNTVCFGLGHDDSKKLPSKRGVKWRKPTKTALRNNQRHISTLMPQL